MAEVLKQDNKWFTEIDIKNGSAFSFKINKKLTQEQSEYQKIEIYETEKFGNLMVIDGFVMLTTKDNFLYHEMLSHPVLYTHKNPENVVIIGGGDCGTLQQVLLHNTVKKVTQIDIDKKVTDLAYKYFPELCVNNDDSRAQLLFADGVKYMQECAPNSLDIIIVDSTDPIGPGEGLFNLAFYKNCFKALKSGGLIVQQSESPLYHLDNILNPMKQEMTKAGFSNNKTLFFPQPCYPSGWWSCTMAGKENNLELIRKEAILNKNFKTKYYNLNIHKAASAMPEFFNIK